MNGKFWFPAKPHSVLAVIGLLLLFSPHPTQGQITPLGDAYADTANPTTNFGASGLLNVDGATQITYILFPLPSIPAGASIHQATLKLFCQLRDDAGQLQRRVHQWSVDGRHD